MFFLGRSDPGIQRETHLAASREGLTHCLVLRDWHSILESK